jgi:lipid-A-disaccharide synthase
LTAPHILISAGEASGDLHAARLAAALHQRTGALLFGLGGPKMRDAGVELVAEYSEVSVLGISEIVRRLPALRRVFRRLLDEAGRRRPALAILVDFPGFHLRLARRLRSRGVRIVYFISPQFWAWRPWRVRPVRKRFERVLCIFPFEAEFYRQAGVNAEYIGHPLVGAVRPAMGREEFVRRWGLDPKRQIVALLPGSRKREVAHNLPAMVEACRQLARNRSLSFVLAAAPGLSAADYAPATQADCGVRVVEGATYDALAAADAAIVSSGTATIEAALLRAPMVVVYRVSRLTALMAQPLVRTEFFAMVNLIAGRRVVTELIQDDFTAENVAAETGRLLDSAEARAEIRRGLEEVEARLHAPCGDPIERAAQVIVEMLREGQATRRELPPS